MGWGGSEGWVVVPILHDKENYLAPSPLFGALRKIFVNFPTTITIVFNKTYFVNKNLLEITNKFIPTNQTNY